MQVALVHDWLTGMRGGEKCLEVFCELFPEADLFTLVHVPGSVSPTIERHRIHTSLLQRLPGSARHYRWYLPLMPTAIETFDLSAYDMVLSSSHCVAKGVITHPEALHVAYVHTPMRYAWDLWPQYFPATGVVSRYVVPIQAFNALRRPLKIIGSGPLAAQLKGLAGPHIEFLGWRSNEELRQYYAACRAVIFPAQEDFGIVPLEANAAGRPVIALGLGGALETVIPVNDPRLSGMRRPDTDPQEAPTGVLFASRTPAALQQAVQFFEAHEALFCPAALRQHALQFDRQLFKQRIQQLLAKKLAGHTAR